MIEVRPPISMAPKAKLKVTWRDTTVALVLVTERQAA